MPRKPRPHRQLSVAPDDPGRSRLFPRGTLLGLALMGAATLTLMWPGRELLQLLRSTQDTGLAIDYLQHLLRLQGHDADLRLLLAQRYISIGKPQQALAALEPLGAEPKADALRLLIWKRIWFDARARHDTALAQQARSALAGLLGRATPANFNDWRSTLLLLQGLDEPATVRRLAPLALRFTPLPPSAAQDAARLLLGLGEYRLAAQVLFASLPAAPAQAQQRVLLQQAAQVLLAAGDAKLAYAEVAAQARKLPPDPALAWSLVQLALAADHARAALHWLGQAVDLRASPAQLGHALSPAQAELAWRLLLADGDLPGALHLANAVLAGTGATPAAQAPGRRRVWEERRAQVLEWSGQPDATMQQWMALLRQRITAEALSNVRRLAGMLSSSSGQIAYWEARARQGGMRANDWLQYAQALENQGYPQQAAAVLRLAAPAHPQLFGALAWLLGNLGETQASLAAYAQGLKLKALDLRASIDDALALLQTGAFETARSVLEQSQQALGPDDLRATRQGLLADLDWDLGQSAPALAAYATLWDTPALRRHMKPYQVERFIVLTQRLHGPAAALALLPQAWQTAPHKELALQWLQALVKLPSLSGLQRWQRTVMQGEVGAALRQDARVYAARAQVWQALGRRDEALADSRTAVRLAPNNRDDQITLLWMLLDMNRRSELRRAFERYAPQLRGRTDGQEVLAAAAQALGDLPLALQLNAQFYPRKRHDPLWLMNAADLLSRAGDDARARVVYDQAWQLLRQPPPQSAAGKPGTAISLDHLLAALRLSPGRTSVQRQQQLIAMLRARLRPGRTGAAPASAQQGQRQELQHERQADAAIADWLLRLDTTAPARWWLARAVLSPADRQSVALQIALQEGDREQVRRLLDQGAGERLDAIDRAEALRAAGHPMQALAQADQALEQAAAQGRASAALQALAQQNAQRHLDLADRSTVRYASQQTDAVQRDGPILQQSLTLTPRLKLQLGVSRQHLSSRDASIITGLPGQWRDAQAGLQWHDGALHLGASLGHNSALGSITPLQLDAAFPLPGGVQAQAQLQRHAVADETGALLVAGRRNRLQISLSKNVGRFWASVSQSVAEYSTRQGDSLGSGRSLQAQAGVWLRQGEPDLALKLLGYSNQFSATGAPQPSYAGIDPSGLPPAAGFFVPAGDDAVGVGFAFNQLVADRYSAHWLPFGELDLLRSRRLGNTTGVDLGLQGPVFGGDQLSVHYQRQQNTTGLVRQWSLQYRIWFGP
ncbi:conserved hypothetical protein [Thiomonas sp. X19]|uniref:tetratricopeptide repeat protein n=1 Tax=Thiomonas sp. X19 TaxID=1050370 RepID=UPI000B6ACEFE|nr:tetratricopeptide repeat protein [Thiomonas sp. X19]SCC93327.1 conserved hypothetical protein [Thiomonas sp. X19]